MLTESNNTYETIRFALFTRSYGATVLKQKIREKKTIRNIQLEKLAHVLLFDKEELRKFIIYNKRPKKQFPDEDKQKIAVYLRIERELTKIMQEKQDKYSSSLEDYERSLLAPAIERIAGNTLNNMNDDSDFEVKLEVITKNYHHWYYWVAYKYRLPTLRILPFILRLIRP